MEKLLTISIAAYNVEAYLTRALRSLELPGLMDALEVLIVNDGSTDGTREIAESFCRAYPGTFRLINQENGGYGTTVNAAMQQAAGRYFRLLDGDDFCDRKGLADLLSLLSDLESDLVVSPMYRVREGSGEMELRRGSFSECAGQTLAASSLPCDLICGIWNLTVRTELLKKRPFALPAHTLYTDMLYVTQVLARVNTITFGERPVYCYAVGRDGQSVSAESRIAHKEDTLRVMSRLLRAYVDEEPEAGRAFMLPRVSAYLVYGCMSLLLDGPTAKGFDEVASLLGTARRFTPEVYEAARRQSARFRLLDETNGLAYFALAGH